MRLMDRADSKTCPRCGATYYRNDKYPQPDSVWDRRVFCSQSCSSRRPRTDEWRARIGRANAGRHRPDLLGKPLSVERRDKLRAANLGRPKSEEHRRKISAARSGPGNNHWRGGITPHNKMIRNRLAGWARAIKTRDGFACQTCGATESLHADHIEPIAFRPDLMFELSNGRTLCAPCHRKTATYGGRRIYFVLRGNTIWPLAKS